MTRSPLLFLPLILLAVSAIGCGARQPDAPKLNELHRASSGDIDAVLLASTDALKQTRNYCTLEFRTGADHHLVDVGHVSVRTTMTMDGQPMAGFVTDPTQIGTGRYEVQMVMAMTGTWQITVEWKGPPGTGTVTFSDAVQ